MANEIGRPELAAVDKRKRQPLGEHRTELLHQVQGQRRPPWAVYVEEPDVGIQPRSRHSRECVGKYQRVDERKERVGRIHWGPTVTRRESPRIPVPPYQVREGLEEPCRRLPFQPPQPIDRTGLRSAPKTLPDAVGGPLDERDLVFRL